MSNDSHFSFRTQKYIFISLRIPSCQSKTVAFLIRMIDTPHEISVRMKRNVFSGYRSSLTQQLNLKYIFEIIESEVNTLFLPMLQFFPV